MAEKDFVILKGDLTLAYSGTLSLEELFQTIKEWFLDRGYDFDEKGYQKTPTEKGFNYKLSLEGYKKITEYVEIHIKVSVKFNNVEQKKGKLATGDLKVGFECYNKMDYEDRWEGTVLKKFTRGLHDKFFGKDKFVKFEQELKEESYDLFDKIKAYLNLQKYK